MTADHALPIPNIELEAESPDAALPPDEILVPDIDEALTVAGVVDTSDAEAEEDDDNPYQESDEALPDDEEEKVIERNPWREEVIFDDV